MKRKEVIKASNLIHVCHTLSLIEQQILNFLLAYAYDELVAKEEHQIALSLIKNYLKTKRGFEYITQVLLQLSIKITYVIIDKEGTGQQGFFQFFQYIRIVDDIAYYSYTEQLKALLSKPRTYAKIDLVTQRAFRSKYALVLYELCVDYSGIGRTPLLTIEQFRRYMAIKPSKYSTFKALNYYIIKKAVSEINKKTDLKIAVEYQRSTKNITAIRFIIKKHTATQLKIEPATLVLPSHVKELESYGIDQTTTQEIARKYSQEQIKEKITLLKKSKNKIHNPKAWLIKALEENWQPGPIKSNFAKASIVPVKKTNNEFDSITYDLEREHLAYIDARLHEIYQALSEEKKQQLEDKFQHWLKSNPFASVLASIVNNSRKHFLILELVPENERSFKQWALTKGYVVEKIDYTYKVINKLKLI